MYINCRPAQGCLEYLVKNYLKNALNTYIKKGSITPHYFVLELVGSFSFGLYLDESNIFSCITNKISISTHLRVHCCKVYMHLLNSFPSSDAKMTSGKIIGFCYVIIFSYFFWKSIHIVVCNVFQMYTKTCLYFAY